MKIRNATSRDLTIAATGQHVEAGKTVEVDDDLGKQLCDQADVWRKSTAKPAKEDD